MAAIKKIDNEGLLNAAYDLVRREGISALSARKLAAAASCSTQPIYENFSGMGKVIEITTQRMNDEFADLVKNVGEQVNAEYFRQGIIVCRYALEEKNLFRYFIMDKSQGMTMLKNEWSVRLLRERNDISDEQAESVDLAMKNYILGKAFLVNSGYEKFDAKEIEQDIKAYLEIALDKKING